MATEHPVDTADPFCECGYRMSLHGRLGGDRLFPNGDRPLCRACRTQHVYLAGLCGDCYAANVHPSEGEARAAYGDR